MKKLVQFGAMIVLGGSLASASILFSSPCSILEAPGASATAATVCSATADPGFFLNSITVTITSDYTGWQNGNPTVTEVYAFIQNTPGLPSTIPNGVVTTTLGGGSGNSNPIQNYNQTVNGNFGSTATVQFSMSNSVASGTVTGASGVMTISATELPAAGLPEPTTMVLLGSGLIGLAAFKRRLKARA